MSTVIAALGGRRALVWPPPPRAPLPAFPPGIYDHILPPNQLIPAGPQRDWPRANWFSVEVPGLPWVADQSSEHPEMVLSYFLQRYTLEWQATILAAHAQRGYTHFMISWANARDYNMSVAAYAAMAARVKAAGFFVHVMLAGKNNDPQDAGWDVLEGRLRPVTEAMLALGALDMVSFWETDLWQGPNLHSNYVGVAAMLAGTGVDQWAHFSTERTWWGEAYGSRQVFWQANYLTLKGLLYQADVSWDMPMRQARMADTTNRDFMTTFASGHHKFCAAEMDGMRIYQKAFSEGESDRNGYLHLCTAGLTPVSGYCSGARRPDGSVL